MKVELYLAQIDWGDKQYSKSLKKSVGEVKIDLERLNVSYDDYLRPILEYFSGKSAKLATGLGVVKVQPRGNHIMGIFGGELKKGKQPYAGLVITNWRVIGRNLTRFKLYNMSKELEDYHNNFTKYLHKLIIRGEIFPFYINTTYDFLFGKEEDLKNYLRRLLALNRDKLGTETELLQRLITEVKVSGDTLKRDEWYVLYRRMRTFAAVAFRPDTDKYVIPAEVSAIHMGNDPESKEKAYFYAATLNFLVYKALSYKISFIRDQFARPLYALAELNLLWNNVDDKTRRKIVALSESLHIKAPSILKGHVKKGIQVKQCFKWLGSIDKFKQLVETLDSYLQKTERGEEEIKEVLTRWIGGERGD